MAMIETDNTFEFGDLAKQANTGFEGIVVAKCEYATGCIQYKLEPRDSKEDKDAWFDAGNLVLVEKQVMSRKPKTILRYNFN